MGKIKDDISLEPTSLPELQLGVERVASFGRQVLKVFLAHLEQSSSVHVQMAGRRWQVELLAHFPDPSPTMFTRPVVWVCKKKTVSLVWQAFHFHFIKKVHTLVLVTFALQSPRALFPSRGNFAGKETCIQPNVGQRGENAPREKQ